MKVKQMDQHHPVLDQWYQRRWCVTEMGFKEKDDQDIKRLMILVGRISPNFDF